MGGNINKSTHWDFPLLKLVSIISVVYGGVYPPINNSIKKDVAVLNLGNRVELLEEAYNCCSSIFSAIYLEFKHPGDFENFLESNTSIDKQNDHKTTNLMISLGDFQGDELDEIHSPIKILSQNDTMDKLQTKRVSGVSIKFREPLCLRSRRYSDFVIKGRVKKFFRIQKLLNSRSIKFGVEPPPSNDFSEECDIHIKRDILPVLQAASFFVIRININEMFYDQATFSNYIKSQVTTEIRRTKAKNVNSANIIKVEVTFESGSETEETLVNNETKNRYKTLISGFAYKFAEFFNENGVTVQAIGEIDAEAHSVKNWTRTVQLEDNSCCNLGEPSNLQYHNLLYQDKQNALDTFSQYFKRMQVTEFDEDYWKIAYSNLTKQKISFGVESSMEFDRGLNDLLADFKKAAEVNTKYPRVITSVLAEVDDDACENTTHTPLEVDINILKQIRFVAQESGILFGVTDCNFFAPDDIQNLHKELIQVADFIQIDLKSETSLAHSLKSVIKISKTFYPNKSVTIRAEWSNSNVENDCHDFRIFYETVFNWARIHQQNILVPDAISFDHRMIRWFNNNNKVKHTSHNSHADPESEPLLVAHVEDYCVTLETNTVTQPINVSKVLAGITLRLYNGKLENATLESRILLFQLVSLKFSRVEFVIEDLSELPVLLQYMQQEIGSIDAVQVSASFYFNLNVNETAGISNMNKIMEKTQALTVLGFHVEVYESKDCKIREVIHDKDANRPMKNNQSEEVKGNAMSQTTQPSLEHGRMIAKCVKFQNSIATDVLTTIRLAIPPNAHLGIIIKYHRATGYLNLYDIDITLLKLVDYIIIDTNLFSTIRDSVTSYSPLENEKIPEVLTYARPNYYREDVYKYFQLFRNVRYKLRKLKPNIVVMLRVRWPVVSNDRESSKYFLHFWKYVADFCTTYDFPYFIYEAFSNENKSVSYGWWEIKNYDDPTNIMVYNEKESEYLGIETLRPALKQSETTQSVIVYLAPASLFVLLILVIVYLGFRLRQKGMVLSKMEVKLFMYGYKSEGKETNLDTDIMGKGYNSDLEIKKRDFKLEHSSVIGFGNFGLVYKTIMSRFEGEVAVKMPKMEESKEHSTVNSFLAEIKVMSYIGEHAYVLKLLGAYTREIRKGIVYMVTEYCDRGSLILYLRNIANSNAGRVDQGHMPFIDMYELNRFCFEIACGMDFICSKQVIHGDLSARNILLSKNKICKISDFGLSRKLEKYEIYKKTGNEPLPWRWLAIESLQRFEFTKKSDVWSYGVTIWEVFSLGDQPFPELRWNEEYVENLEKGMRLRIPRLARPDVYDTMLNCWNLEPTTRPEFSDIAEVFRKLNLGEYSTLNSESLEMD